MELVKIKINGEYDLILPEYRAARPEWLIENGGWEVERINEMVDLLTPNDILFDCGTEAGDISALLVKESGCKICMFEPNDRVWPSITAVWKANNLPEPLDFFGGFLSDKTIAHPTPLGLPEFGKMISDHGFKQLYENYPDVAQITLDDYCERKNIYPTVITMDCEGSEWNIIKGAEKTLREKKPTIFMSVHPEFLFDSYRNEGIWKEKYGERCFAVHMIRFINELGYRHRVIEWDYHEIHVRFDPVK